LKLYANPEKNEYHAMVDRVRKHYGSGVEVGGYNSHDINKLRKLDQQRQADEILAEQRRPLNEAATRQHVAYERAMKAWRLIGEKQDALARDRRLHEINGLDLALLEPVGMPQRPGCRSIEDYDLSAAEISELATELETKAGKLRSYVSQWESSSPDQRNLSLILALAERLDRLERGRA
jgi:hypothetical protein